MNGRLILSAGVIATAGVLLAAPVRGQTAGPTPAAARTTAAGKPADKGPSSKTPWGDPDLQGVYTFSTLTPLQKPNSLTGKEALTEVELAEQEEQDAQNRVAEDRPVREGDTGTYNNFWTSNEKGRRTGKVALIVDPPDGRIPELTPQGKKVRDQLTAEASARRV